MARITPRHLWWLGLLGLLSLTGEPLLWTRFLFLLFLAPLVVDVVGWLRRRRSADPSAPAIPDRPLPGPAERAGPLLFLLRYVVSDALVLLGRDGRRQVLAQMRGEVRARKRVGDSPPGPDAYVQKVEYTPPFSGTWLVARGGVTRETSHSWDILSQRYAYDFLIADDEGRTHVGDGSAVTHYHAYGEPILAPADGEVVDVIDGVRDAPRVGTGWIDWRAPHIGGNSVTIKHAPDEFSYLAHLVPGSIPVRPGQHVRRGDLLGLCGNSGHSTEPHLHFQVQDQADFFQAAGLPVRITLAGAEGEPFRSLHLSAGMRVRGQAEPG